MLHIGKYLLEKNRCASSWSLLCRGAFFYAFFLYNKIKRAENEKSRKAK